MFFIAIIALPLVGGVVAGVVSSSRRVPLALALVCIALGAAGAVAVGVDSHTTDRAGSIGFALGAGLVAAGLVYAGWLGARKARGLTVGARAA